LIWIFVFLILNFAISWNNSVSVGRMWSESKVIGGSLRVLAVSGYVMAVGGFTMVYGNILLMISPYIIPIFLPEFPVDSLLSLTNDMLYVLIVAFLIPTGNIIWFNSVVNFWRRRTLANGLPVAWNSYAQIRNTVNAARHLPSAFSRITKALFGGKGKKKGNAALIFMAVFILVLAVLGGWFTASAIMKKADLEYDGFEEFEPEFG